MQQKFFYTIGPGVTGPDWREDLTTNHCLTFLAAPLPVEAADPPSDPSDHAAGTAAEPVTRLGHAVGLLVEEHHHPEQQEQEQEDAQNLGDQHPCPTEEGSPGQTSDRESAMERRQILVDAFTHVERI